MIVMLNVGLKRILLKPITKQVNRLSNVLFAMTSSNEKHRLVWVDLEVNILIVI